MTKSLILFFFVWLFIACKSTLREDSVLIREKNLFPEGIAAGRDKLFVSSIAKNKIVA